MKTYKLLLGLLAAASITACSSDDPINPNPGLESNGKGYLRLAINLPTTTGTRTASGLDNDQFEDGDATEYGVQDATLIVFTGTDEANATFQAAYSLNITDWANNSSYNDVTVSGDVVYKLAKDVTPGDNMYALVVLNKGDLLTETANNGLTVNGTALTVGNSKYTDLATYTKTSGADAAAGLHKSTAGFFMSNAPLAGEVGGATATAPNTCTTLVKINKDNIKSSEAEAKTAPAAIVNVERALAKVKVTGPETAVSETTDNVPCTIKGWGLNRTNKSSYVVRKFQSAWLGYQAATGKDYRFVGADDSKVPAATTDGTNFTYGYRTYWAEDPNYGSNDAATTQIADAGLDWNPILPCTNALASAAYCCENTFGIRDQWTQSTTTAYVKVQFNASATGDDKTFWTVKMADPESPAVAADAFKTEEQAKTAIMDQVKKLPLFTGTVKAGEEDNITISFGAASFDTDGAAKLNNMQNEVTVTATTSNLNGDNVTDDQVTAFKTAIQNYIKANFRVRKYVNGFAYYPVLIRHFSDAVAPWTVENKMYTDATTDGPQKFLGRYGVVRNNFYDIQITSIKQLGEPNMPVLDHQDDDFNSYISFKINIMPWAKRTQSVVLQ